MVFGSLVMPNLYLGLGAVAVVGLFLRAVQHSTWWRIASVGAVAGLISLVRPTDSVLVLAPLFACALAVEPVTPCQGTRCRRRRERSRLASVDH